MFPKVEEARIGVKVTLREDPEKQEEEEEDPNLKMEVGKMKKMNMKITVRVDEVGVEEEEILKGEEEQHLPEEGHLLIIHKKRQPVKMRPLKKQRP